MADARGWRPVNLRTFARGVYRGVQNAAVYGVGAGAYDRIRQYVSGGAKRYHQYSEYPWLSRTGSGRTRRRFGRGQYRRNNYGIRRFYGRRN